MDIVRTDKDGLWVEFRTYAGRFPYQPTVYLIPTVHVADAPFFDDCKSWTNAGDVQIFEGVDGGRKLWLLGFLHWCASAFKSKKLQRQSSSSRSSQASNEFKAEDSGWKLNSRSGRYERKIKWLNPDDVTERQECRYVRADMRRDEFLSAIAGFPKWFLLTAPIGITLVGFWFMWSLRKNLTEEAGDPTGAIFYNWSQQRPGSIKQLIGDLLVTRRDKILIQTLRSEIEDLQNTGKIISITYGAAHMGAVDNFLTNEMGYSCCGWRDVLAVATDIKHVEGSRPVRDTVSLDDEDQQDSVVESSTLLGRQIDNHLAKTG